MRVRALDKNDDWTFGRGNADYIDGKAALNQKVKTRLKSFKYDNPLNMESNIDWIDLLGRKGTQDTILKEIERVVLSTDGVTKITQLSVMKTVNRKQLLSLRYLTIYDDEDLVEFEL